MNTAKAYYDGRVFVPLSPVVAKRNQTVVVTIPDCPEPVKPKSFLRCAGALSEEGYRELADILVDTEKVDVDEW